MRVRDKKGRVEMKEEGKDKKKREGGSLKSGEGYLEGREWCPEIVSGFREGSKGKSSNVKKIN